MVTNDPTVASAVTKLSILETKYLSSKFQLRRVGLKASKLFLDFILRRLSSHLLADDYLRRLLLIKLLETEQIFLLNDVYPTTLSQFH